MKFEEVIGQQHTKQQLLNMVQQNRLSHALLFLGKEGSGALPLAFAFAQYVVCETVNGKPLASAGSSLFGEEPQPAGQQSPTDSCGICPACIKAQQYIHPDIHFSYPVIPRKSGDKPLSTDYISEWREFIKQFPYGNVYDWLQFIGAENKQGNITAHECNDIIRQMNLKSFESEYKILIMWMPEYLGNEGNKLLKLIEEPPPKTLLIFVAENDNLILPTILSRLQLVKLPPLHENDIANALIKKAGINENAALQIASVAEGNYREALQLMQHTEEDWQSLIREWLNSMLKTGPAAQVKWIEEMAKLGREKQKQFLRYFNHLLEQGIRLRLMNNENLIMPSTERDFAERINKICSVSQQKAIVEELDRTTYYIERNANAKILFHALTLRLYHIIKDNSLILVD
jgi:DNA polymerase-3 subunit delta'